MKKHLPMQKQQTLHNNIIMSAGVCATCTLYTYIPGAHEPPKAIPTASVLQGQEKQCGDFAETTAFDRYGVKTSEKANMHNEHWLTSTRFSLFSAPWTNEVTKGICIQVQRCSKPTHDHAGSL